MLHAKEKIAKGEISKRQRRVGMIIQKALSEIFISENYEITLCEVQLTRDLRIADIYVLPAFQTNIKNNEEKIEELKKNQARIKQKLAPKIYLKYMPQLRFRLDENFTAAQKLEEILS